MRDALLDIIYYSGIGYSDEEIADIMSERYPDLSDSWIRETIDNVMYGRDVASFMNDDPYITLRSSDVEGRLEGDWEVFARIRLGNRNPVYIDITIDDLGYYESLNDIMERIRQGRNDYGLSPGLLQRLIRYPDTSGIEIITIIPR